MKIRERREECPCDLHRQKASSERTKPRLHSNGNVMDVAVTTIDEIPDQCLGSIFKSLITPDRKNCSLVCHRWLKIQGQYHHNLYLSPPKPNFLPSIFSRFDSVTQLTLSCQGNKFADEDLILVSHRCPNLTSLTIHDSDLTDSGLEALATKLKGLNKFSCTHGDFGYKGLTALIHHCIALEELSVTYLRGIDNTDGDGEVAAASPSLKAIHLQDIAFFCPFIFGAKNLTVLKIVRCNGEWDKILHALLDQVPCIVELHLESLNEISDVGVKAISKCSSLEVLHLVKNVKCSDAGLIAVAEGCKFIRELHIMDGWNGTCHKGLISVVECCRNIQELALIGMNISQCSFQMLASSCWSLERLAYRRRSTLCDIELPDIGSNLFESEVMNMWSDMGVYYWIKTNPHFLF